MKFAIQASIAVRRTMVVSFFFSILDLECDTQCKNLKILLP